jgi:MYXO-CTERM domain-containing protein
LLPDPNRQGVIYAASKFSGVFVSTDGADTWTSLVNGLERKDAQVLALSQDGTVLYLGTASGSGGAGVWRLGTPAGLPTAEVTQPAAQVLAPSSTETPSAKPGICGSASILPLALVGLARWRRRRQEEMES